MNLSFGELDERFRRQIIRRREPRFLRRRAKAGVDDRQPLLAVEDVISRCKIISLWKFEIANITLGDELGRRLPEQNAADRVVLRHTIQQLQSLRFLPHKLPLKLRYLYLTLLDVLHQTVKVHSIRVEPAADVCAHDLGPLRECDSHCSTHVRERSRFGSSRPSALHGASRASDALGKQQS